jgi:protein-tyrosine phosphatase
LYDIHNHVLPGTDDGSKGLRMSLRMLEQAILQGITHVACTPHANDRSGEEANKLFHSAFDKLAREVKSLELPVEIGLAAEIMFGAELQQTLNYSFATYNGRGRYFLLEFSRETPFEIILNVVRASCRWKKRPVIAHFERYRHACKDKMQPDQVRAEGGILSLDAGSLTGQFGKPMVKVSKKLLEWNCIDIIASDAHDDDTHGFCLKTGREAVCDMLGANAAERMTIDNPKLIWENHPWHDEKDKRSVLSNDANRTV